MLWVARVLFKRSFKMLNRTIIIVLLAIVVLCDIFAPGVLYGGDLDLFVTGLVGS